MKLDNIAVSLSDDRDIPYAAIPGPYPAKLDLKPEVYEIEDQGSVGSCTCNSSVSALEMLKPASYSRLFAYWQTRNVVEDRPGQEGASLRDAIRSHYHYGVPLETLWPYDVAQVNAKPSDAAYTDAAARRVTRYERITLDTQLNHIGNGLEAYVAQIKSALNEGLAVVIAARVGKQIYGLSGPWQTHNMQPCNVELQHSVNEWIGNHATLIVGYDDAPADYGVMKGKWLVQNSWSKSWGDGGFYGIGYFTLACDIMEAWVVRSFADVAVDTTLIPESIVRGWYEDTNFVADAGGVAYWRDPANGGARAFYGTVKALTDAKCNARLAQL